MEWVDGTKFNFYTVLGDKLVVGFDDENEAKEYAKKNRFKVYARATLQKKKIDYNNLDNWTDEYPENF